MSTNERWLANHAVTDLWSGWDNRAISWTLVPQWSFFQQVENQQGKRIHVHYYGNSIAEEGDVWVDAEDVGPIDRPSHLTEPEWPHPAPPPPETTAQNPGYQPPTAPPIPPEHLPHLATAAHLAEVDVGVLAATGARESGFQVDAYREERQLEYVRWRPGPGDAPDRYPDGSVGVCQVLRSNFLAFGVDSDAEARDLANNYRIAAMIIRDNFAAFPGDAWKAVAAYNVGQYGARAGRVPAGGYTDTILRWADEYRPLFQQPKNGSAAPSTPSGDVSAGPPVSRSGRPDDPASASPSNGDAQLSGKRDQMIQYGMTLLGTPYVFGAKFCQRDKGIDCSGFVCEVLEHCGVDIGNREYLSADAIRQMTRPIDESEARAGDLIFFAHTYDTPGASHIGFWLKPGQMLDAHGAGVQLTNLQTPYWQEHLMALGRLPALEHEPAPGALPRPARRLAEPEPDRRDDEAQPASGAAACSFCGRSRGEVGRLIGGLDGDKVAICDNCVSIYAEMIDDRLPFAGR